MPTIQFLVLEGCNGVGKSTLAEYLCAAPAPYRFITRPSSLAFAVRCASMSICAGPRLAYYLAATLHLRTWCALNSPRVMSSAIVIWHLSLMIGESSIEETRLASWPEPFESYTLHPRSNSPGDGGRTVASARIYSNTLCL